MLSHPERATEPPAGPNGRLRCVHQTWPKSPILRLADSTIRHGKQFYHTWTRLARRVTAGDTTLLLQGTVNWEPGQQVWLLLPTALNTAHFLST